MHLKDSNQNDQTDEALKSMRVSVFDKVCIHSLRNRHIGHSNVPTLTILQHLCDRRTNVVEQDLEDNVIFLKNQCDPSAPLETLIDQAEDAVDCAAAGKSPHAKKQIVNAARTFVFSTSAFNDCFKD